MLRWRPHRWPSASFPETNSSLSSSSAWRKKCAPAHARRVGVLELAAKVKQLEHEADRVHQDAIVELFDQERDPIAVIKWKEIFDFLEAATDRCEDVANLLEGVIVKHT